MPNLRELVAAALQSSDLSQSPLIEAAIDRVGGMAFSDPLGAELWRLLAYQADAYERVVALLAKRGRDVIVQAGMRRKVCVAVLYEFLDTACRTCKGTGHVATATMVQRLCPTCEGSLRRRYSDLWRARELGLTIDTYPKWDRRYALIGQLLADADRAIHRELAQQLERVVPKSAAKVLEFHAARATLRKSASPTYQEQQGERLAYSTATL